MKKVLCLVLALLLCAVSACAEMVEMPGLVFEVPAGFTMLESDEPGICYYMNASSSEGVLGYCLINDAGWSLPEATNALAAEVGCQESGISTGHYTGGQPVSYLTYMQDGQKMRMAIVASADYIYAIGYVGGNEQTWTNVLLSIKGENLIGIGGYEIVSTQEYVRTPFRGLSYRVYTPDGRVDAETAMAIYDELFYKNQYDGYDLTSVWFYDMRSAAEEGGLIYGRIMQDDLSQEVEYEEMQ